MDREQELLRPAADPHIFIIGGGFHCVERKLPRNAARLHFDAQHAPGPAEARVEVRNGGPGPVLVISVWQPVVGDHQSASGVEVPMSAMQRLSIVVTPAADPKHATHIDGPVRAAEVELVHRLHAESGFEAAAGSLRLGEGDHVGGYVATVDVEPLGQERD